MWHILFDYNTNKDNLRELLSPNQFIIACPYCNLNYISVIKNEGNSKFIYQLDHFYDKATHPYFALSFYNLIPVCSDCNGPNFKHGKKFTIDTHIHPYHESFHEHAKFTIGVTENNLDDYITPYYDKEKTAKDGASIELKLIPTNGDNNDSTFKKCKNNAKDLCLVERTELHKEYIYEILTKAYYYPRIYLNNLQTEFKELFFSSASENNITEQDILEKQKQKKKEKIYDNIDKENFFFFLLLFQNILFCYIVFRST